MGYKQDSEVANIYVMTKIDIYIIYFLNQALVNDVSLKA